MRKTRKRKLTDKSEMVLNDTDKNTTVLTPTLTNIIDHNSEVAPKKRARSNLIKTKVAAYDSLIPTAHNENIKLIDKTEYENIKPSITQQQHLNTHSKNVDVFDCITNNSNTNDRIPLPNLNWTLNTELWSLMRKKECHVYTRDCTYLKRHIGIEAQMRTILLDWIVEISYEYRLHRETFHLAVEYIDRFLSIKENMKVDRLQLIGMTALFLAAKAEEIYPPKLREFAAHMENYSNNNEDAITQFELFMLKSLNWQISPITANTWLNIYLQIANLYNIDGVYHTSSSTTQNHTTKIQNCVLNTKFLLPNYCKLDYLKAITLLDLCLFDIESIKFKYSELAACAIYHMLKPNDLAFLVSGYKLNDLDECIQWMSPYADVIKECVEDKIQIKYFGSVEPDDAHNIQLYFKNLDLWKEAQLRKTPSKIYSNNNTNNDNVNLLTPPDSNKKSK